MRSLLTLNKEHEQGFIAYNINSNKKKLISIKIEDGEDPSFDNTAIKINDELAKHFA